MGDPLVSEAVMLAAFPAFSDVDADERTRRILAASASIEAYVGRPLGRDTYTETHRPGSTRRIYLRVTPVSSITSIVAGRSGSEVTLATTDYDFDPDTGEVELYASYPGANSYRYPDRMSGGDPRAGNLVCTYVGGWATEDVPADLQEYAIRTVMAGGAILGLSGAGMFASEQIGSYSYRISASADSSTAVSGLPATVAAGLRKYRRVRIV